MKYYFLIIVLLLSISDSFAGIQTGILTRFGVSVTDDGQTAGQKNTQSDLDFRIYLGWGFGSAKTNFHLGATVLNQTVTNKINSNYLVSTYKYTGVGATIGGSMNGFVFDFTLFLNPLVTKDKTPDGGSLDYYQDGKGIELGFGYNFMLYSKFALGPKFVYRSLSWGKANIVTNNVGNIVTYPNRYKEEDGRFYVNFEFFF